MNDVSIEFAVKIGNYCHAGKIIKVMTKLDEFVGSITGIAILGTSGQGGLINSFTMNGDLSNIIYVDTILSVEVIGLN